MTKRDPRPWPYSVGKKGVNRVRVYNRADSQHCQIEWVDDRGRQQRSLRSILQAPVIDRTLARDIAEAMSAEQGRMQRERARRMAERAQLVEPPSPLVLEPDNFENGG